MSEIRNVAVLSHSGAGKTSLVEALLFRAGAIKSLGTVEDGNKVAFHPVTIIRDTRDGVWVTGLPFKINVITVGQEFVQPGQIVGLRQIRQYDVDASARVAHDLGCQISQSGVIPGNQQEIVEGANKTFESILRHFNKHDKAIIHPRHC